MKTRRQRYWRKIEEQLIFEGFVLADDGKDYKVWVDCVSNGRDIAYSIFDLRKQSRTAPFATEGTFVNPVFEVLCDNSIPGIQVYKTCRIISAAIKHSRDNRGPYVIEESF